MENAVDTAAEETTFFSRKNQLRSFAMFVSAIVVVVFLIRLDGSANLLPSQMVMSFASKTATSVDSTGSFGDKFLDGFRSMSRLVPIRNNEALKGFGFVNTFKAKYQLLESRDVSKNYKPPSVKSDGSATSDNDGMYLYNVVYSGEECSGSVYAVSGASIGNCNTVPNNGDDDVSPYQSYILDCVDGDVIMNMYAADDCSFFPALSEAVGSYDTCISSESKHWTSISKAPFTDANTLSINRLCTNEQSVDTSRYVVFKYHTGETFDECMESPKNTLNSEFFEAYPVGACEPATAVDYRRRLGQTEESEMSFELGYKPTLDNTVFANVYSGSETCDGTPNTSVAPTDCYGDESTGFYTSVQYFA